MTIGITSWLTCAIKYLRYFPTFSLIMLLRGKYQMLVLISTVLLCPSALTLGLQVRDLLQIGTRWFHSLAYSSEKCIKLYPFSKENIQV